MNSSFCCTCAGTCCHTGPHMYCEKHMGSALRVLADIVLPCPSCAKWSVTANDQAQTIEALRARVAVLEKVAEDTEKKWRFVAHELSSSLAANAEHQRRFNQELSGKDAVINWAIAEMDCRIEHGADSRGHLEYFRTELRRKAKEGK